MPRSLTLRLAIPARAACLALALAFVLSAPARAEDDLPPTSEFFDEYDANLDGVVTTDEFRGSGAIFRLLDADGNGRIEPAELGLPPEYKPKRRPHRPGRDRPGGDRAGRGGPRGGDDARATRRARFLERLKAMDTDQDGRVSQAEWQGRPEAFKALDANKDGYLDGKDARQRGREPRRDGPRPGAKDADERPDAKGGDERPGHGRRRGDDGEGTGKPAHDAEERKRMEERAAARFAEIDRNDDGALDGNEVPNARILEAMDGDGDGTVSKAEFLEAVRKRAQRGRRARPDDDRPRGRGPRFSAGMLRRWDRNGDGKVGKDEFPGREDLFARLDADGDGHLTESDVKAASKARRKPPERGDAPPTKKQPRSIIEQMDADGDGKLSREEFQGEDAIWKLLDKNGDGYITSDELTD